VGLGKFSASSQWRLRSRKMNGRILVLNCHEAWIHQLRLLDQPLDIVVGLPGLHKLQ
jgi:hypothetical protein